VKEISGIEIIGLGTIQPFGVAVVGNFAVVVVVAEE